MGCLQTRHLYKENPAVWYSTTSALEADYKISQSIGEGRHATVRIITCQKTGKVYAGKCFDKRIALSDNNDIYPAPDAKKLEMEITLLRTLKPRRAPWGWGNLKARAPCLSLSNEVFGC